MGKLRAILFLRLKSMGDIVFTIPAVHAVRTQAPQARIIFLVSKEYAPLLQGFRDVDAVIELDRERFRRLHPVKMLRESYQLIRRMRREQLDLAIDLQGYGETALLSWASGASERWGTVYRPGRSWAYTDAVPRHLDVHPAEDYLLLLRRHGLAKGPARNQFKLPNEAITAAAECFGANGLDRELPTLFIQPFTSTASKNWPLERYLEVAAYWRRRKWQVIFGGGPADVAVLEPARKAGYAVVAGVPLIVSAGLADLSSLVLGGDTGLVHLAVAMGKRVVMIMRSVFAGSTHPFQHPEWAITATNKDPVSSISVAAVIDHCAHASAEMGISTDFRPDLNVRRVPQTELA